MFLCVVTVKTGTNARRTSQFITVWENVSSITYIILRPSIETQRVHTILSVWYCIILYDVRYCLILYDTYLRDIVYIFISLRMCDTSLQLLLTGIHNYANIYLVGFWFDVQALYHLIRFSTVVYFLYFISGALLLGLIEGVGILITRFSAEQFKPSKSLMTYHAVCIPFNYILFQGILDSKSLRVCHQNSTHHRARPQVVLFHSVARKWITKLPN